MNSDDPIRRLSTYINIRHRDTKDKGSTLIGLIHRNSFHFDDIVNFKSNRAPDYFYILSNVSNPVSHFFNHRLSVIDRQPIQTNRQFYKSDEY